MEEVVLFLFPPNGYIIQFAPVSARGPLSELFLLINFVSVTTIARGSLLIARTRVTFARGSLFDKRSFP